MKIRRTFLVLTIYLASLLLPGPLISTPLNTSGDSIQDVGAGLQWTRCVAGQAGPTCSGTPTLMNWGDSMAYCESLSQDGHTDWRLPTINELRSIVDYSREDPALDPIFPFGSSGEDVSVPHWSSTNHPSSSSSRYEFSMTLEFQLGTVDDMVKDSVNAAVRCVRTL